MKQSILVVGGAGYIGSHMVKALLEADYQPVVFDNLSTGHESLVPAGAVFVEGDLKSGRDLAGVFKRFDLCAVMHFAALSIVPESIGAPLKYYQNNVAAFLNLLENMIAHDVKKLIFSSTAAVYGESRGIPIPEEFPARPLNPYGRSKLMMEQILADVAVTYPMAYVIFRYFNAAGAHACGELGERHFPETHLIPNLLAAVSGGDEFSIFGDNYPTRDGTCVRDYVHVQDLCEAHLKGLRYLERGGVSEIFNLGTQQGFSVREVIRVVEQVTGETVPVRIAARRRGDPPELIANSKKAKSLLGWGYKENLETIIRSAHQWHQKSASCAAKAS